MKSTSEVVVENGVLIGTNGDLFLAGGRHEIVEFMRGRQLPERTTLILHDNITRRKTLASHHGAGFLQLVAPEKYMVQPENFPLAEPGHFASAYLAKNHGDLVYPVDELRSAGGSAYDKTDSHWSAYGLVAITGLVARKAGIEPQTVDAVLEPVLSSIGPNGTTFSGDLGRKLVPPQSEPKLSYAVKFTHKTYENGMGHDFKKPINDGRMIAVESPNSASDKTLLIFGDSYIYHAIDLLALFFRRILYCRSRYFHEEMVVMVQPDMILCQMAERYMGSVSADEKAPPFFLVPHMLERPISMTVETTLAFARVLSGKRSFDPAAFGIKAQESPAAG